MSIVRYIGARYVPRFVGPFVATQTYEALDVVLDENEVTYISKIPVPAGSSLLDTTYWIPYAEGAAIADLQSQIDTINEDITDMKDGNVAGSLQNQIDGLDSTIVDMKDGNVSGSLQNQIDGLDSAIDDMKDGNVSGSLQNQINKLDDLSVTNFVVTHGNSKTLTLSAGFKGCLISAGTAMDLATIYSMTCDSSGNVRCDKLANDAAGTAVSVSIGSYTITFTNNSGIATFNPRILVFSGSVTT